MDVFGDSREICRVIVKARRGCGVLATHQSRAGRPWRLRAREKDKDQDAHLTRQKEKDLGQDKGVA